jgi:ABC-type phosphate/phosphonate transport system substrate-binding protein
MKKIHALQHLALILFSVVVTNCTCTSTNAQTEARKPLVVFVTGDHEYSGEATLALIAAYLEQHYGFRTKFLKAFPDHNAEENIPGLEALKQADVAVFFSQVAQAACRPGATDRSLFKEWQTTHGFPHHHACF